MNSLQLQCHRESSLLIISLNGRLDGNSAREFKQFLCAHLNEEDHNVVLDASHLLFLSSAGLRELMALSRKLGKNGIKASIAGATPLVRETLAMTGIDGLFHLVHNLESAPKNTPASQPGMDGILRAWFKGKS